MQRRNIDLEMDKGTYCLDTANDPSRIPQDWILRPQFHIWPPQRHRAVLWLLAHILWLGCGRVEPLHAGIQRFPAQGAI